MTDFITQNSVYALFLIPILTYIFYGKEIKDRFKKNIKIEQRNIDEADILKHFKNIDIQSFHGSLKDLIDLSPFIKININEKILNNNKRISAKACIETKTWWILIDAYRNTKEDEIFFVIFAINKLPVTSPIFISNIIKQVNLNSNNEIKISIYKDID